MVSFDNLITWTTHAINKIDSEEFDSVLWSFVLSVKNSVELCALEVCISWIILDPFSCPDEMPVIEFVVRFSLPDLPPVLHYRKSILGHCRLFFADCY